MKNTLLFLLLSSIGLQAQIVSFTPTPNLIGDVIGFTTGDCAVDMNGDYLDDIVRVHDSGIYIDFQQENGSFIQEFYPVSFSNSPSWSICAGDLDENGFNDLLFGGGSAVSFVMANEGGTAYSEAVDPAYIFSQRSTLFDIDNDGDLDAFVCHDVDLSHPYRNDGNGVMVEDQSLIPTVNLPGNYAAIWVDYNNDSHTDLYITKCRGGSSPGDPARTNGLYRNNGDGTFTEVGTAANMDDNAQSWATVFEDFDNDGDFDAFIVNHDFTNRFKLNNGDGTFTDMIEETGIDAYDLVAWSNASADFNNDGFVDIIADMTPSLYINNGDLTFTGQDAPFKDGGIGDFNNDGFLDMIRGSQVYLNDGNDNNWIKINTRGIISNRNGIGARVEIYGEWGIQIREVRSGESFRPMSSLCTHFGIGTATAIDSVIIRWPSGLLTSINNPDINTTHNLVEASCLLAPAAIGVNGSLRLCAGETVALFAPDGYETLLWSTGDTSLSIEVSSAGSYGLLLYDTAGCVSIAPNVAVYDYEDVPPTVAAEGDLTVCAGESVTLHASDGQNHIWTNGMTGQTIEVTEAGVYGVSVDSVCGEGSIAAVETITVETLNPVAPEIEMIVISDSDVATITASGENLQWFDVAEGGTAIAQGTVFETTTLLEDTTFYIESHNVFSTLQSGGKLTTVGGGGIPSVGAYSFFNAFQNFTILSVDVLVPDEEEAGPRTIQLFDGDDFLLQEIVVDLALGHQTIALNFEVPEGTAYSLRCLENNIFRNNSNVFYPYPIGTNMGELTTSLFGDSYYYYFYNWQVETESITCISERIPVEIIIVNVNDLTAIDGLRVFPNPTSEKINIELTMLEEVALHLSLTNNLGQVVFNEKLDTQGLGQYLHTIDVSHLPSGLYQLQLSNGMQAAVMKIVVK